MFDFAINDVSNDLMAFLNHFQIDEDDIDYYVFHQAQNMILNTIDDTCGIDREKELRSMEGSVIHQEYRFRLVFVQIKTV